MNDGASYATDINVKVTYKSDNAAVTYVTFQDREWFTGIGANTGRTTESLGEVLRGRHHRELKLHPADDHAVRRGHRSVQVNFYTGVAPVGVLAAIGLSQTFTLDFSGPPISVLDLDPAAGWHPGRGDILWTNGDDVFHGPGDVWGTFGQRWSASMGVTHWLVTKNNDATVVKTPITWVPWGTSTPGAIQHVMLVEEPNPMALINPKPRYSADGVYQIQHWAVDRYGQRQQNDSYDTFGYDTKAPYVVWQWPATTTGYYTGNIAVKGDIIDDGGSGVAGYFAFTPFGPEQQMPIHFSPKAIVMWKSAETGGVWAEWEGWGTRFVRFFHQVRPEASHRPDQRV